MHAGLLLDKSNGALAEGQISLEARHPQPDPPVDLVHHAAADRRDDRATQPHLIVR